MHDWTGFLTQKQREAILVFSDAYLEGRVAFPDDLHLIIKPTPKIMAMAAIMIDDAIDPIPIHMIEGAYKGLKKLKGKQFLDTALVWASLYNRNNLIALLLRARADVHVDFDAPLRSAAYSGNTDAVRTLLEAGGDFHADDDYALRWAARHGHADVVQLLLEDGADVHAGEEYALRWAARNGHTDVVQSLLENGANIHENENEALRWAATYGKIDTLGLLQRWIAEHG